MQTQPAGAGWMANSAGSKYPLTITSTFEWEEPMSLSEWLNALMAVPNLIGPFALGGLVANETHDYLRRLDMGQF